MLTLYSSPTSPFVRKVNLVILELGLQDRVESIAASGTPLAPGNIPVDKNPLGKVPTLVREDGRAIYDSRVICRYLDDLAGGGLYPQDRLWDVLTLEATADGIMEAALLMIYESRLRPEDKRFPDWVEGQWAKVARALDHLEADWVAAETVDMGQLALAAALGYVDFRHGARDWRKGHDKLANWQAGFAKRPSVQATIPA